MQARLLSAALQRQGRLSRNRGQHKLRLQQWLCGPFLHFENLSKGEVLHQRTICGILHPCLFLQITLRRTAQDMAVAKLCQENATVKQGFMKTTAASAAAPVTAGLLLQPTQTAEQATAHVLLVIP